MRVLVVGNGYLGRAAALGLLAVLASVPGCEPSYADALQETRYCGVFRDEDGTIVRSWTVRTAFRRIHACPSTGLTTGACPGWAIDHVIPLVCGGCDAVGNLQWLPNEIKSAAGMLPKDRWEQRVYCTPILLVPP